MKKGIIVFGLLLSGFTTRAQTIDPDTTAKHFLTMASIGNLQEVSAGQLASQKATRANVKAFGKMMVTDHQDAEAKLLALAKRKSYQLPTPATGGIQPDLNLKNAGNNFDALYVHNMVVAHRNTVQMFETYANTGKDPDVKTFAQQTLPILRHHLEEVMAIEKQMKKNLKLVTNYFVASFV